MNKRKTCTTVNTNKTSTTKFVKQHEWWLNCEKYQQ